MAQSVQISVAGAGNATENKNLINPRFQAEALRQLRGYDTGVLKNSFFTETSPKGIERTNNDNFMWKLDVSGGVSNIKVGRGMATAFGYDIQSETEVTLSTTPPAANYKYVFIYLEWDLHNTQIASGTIKLHDNGSSDNWTPPNQDNLITNPIGTYQMILYRLTVNTSGAITATSNWELFGTRTIGYPLRSENANNCENADYAYKAKDYDTQTGGIKEKFAGIVDNSSAPLFGYNVTKGTIEGRLSLLGFKSGEFIKTDNSYVENISSPTFRELGKIIYGEFTIKFSSSYIEKSIFEQIGTLSNLHFFNDETEYVIGRYSWYYQQTNTIDLILKNGVVYIKTNNNYQKYNMNGATRKCNFTIDLYNHNSYYNVMPQVI